MFSASARMLGQTLGRCLLGGSVSSGADLVSDVSKPQGKSFRIDSQQRATQTDLVLIDLEECLSELVETDEPLRRFYVDEMLHVLCTGMPLLGVNHLMSQSAPSLIDALCRIEKDHVVHEVIKTKDSVLKLPDNHFGT